MQQFRLHIQKKIVLPVLILMGAGSFLVLSAQTGTTPVEIIHADKVALQKSADSSDLTILEGNVQMRQGNTLFKCNRCVKNDRTNTFEAWGNVHINDSDTTDIYSDHLRYLTDRQIAYLDGNVKLTDGNATLTAPSVEYNMGTNIATYQNGGKVVNKKTVITSKAANYYTDIKDVIFMRDVKVNDPAYNIVTDSLLYNTDNQVAKFITHTVIRDSANRTITTKEGFYNLRSGDAEFGQRSMVNDDNKSTVIADSLTLTEGFAQAKGNAVVVDSVRGTIIIADLIYQNRLSEAVLATRSPLMIIKQDNDSIYVTADTLFSAKLTDLYDYESLPVIDSVTKTVSDSLSLQDSVSLPVADPEVIAKQVENQPEIVVGDPVKPDSSEQPSMPPVAPARPQVPEQANVDSMLTQKPLIARSPSRAFERDSLQQKKPGDNDSTNRYFEAFHNVKIYTDSMQAVSDSLFYSFRDSTFRLYKDPVVWAQGSQVTGDTLLMHTKYKKPHWFEAIGKGFMINHLEHQAFNQVKSSRMDGYFTDGALDSVRAKGSAEAIYYLQDDDSAYTGINQSTSDLIDAYLRDKQLKKVVLRGQPKGTIYPIRQKNPKEMQLQGFSWREAERPKTKYDLF